MHPTMGDPVATTTRPRLATTHRVCSICPSYTPTCNMPVFPPLRAPADGHYFPSFHLILPAQRLCGPDLPFPNDSGWLSTFAKGSIAGISLDTPQPRGASSLTPSKTSFQGGPAGGEVVKTLGSHTCDGGSSLDPAA